MFANSQRSRIKRRGIVLVLILGMLSLLALIGVTFATFAGQSLVNNRNYAIGVGRPNAEQLMDYALSQLINDTNNPLSALRGHSLLRDMYGNDSVFRGTNPQNSTNSLTRGLLTSVTEGGVTAAPQITAFRPYSQYSTASPLSGKYLQFRTNIPTAARSYAYYGLNFTRWVLRINTGNGVNQTFEVLEDDDTGSDPFSNGYHLLTLSNNLGIPDISGAFLTTNSDYISRVFKFGNVTRAPDDAAVPRKQNVGLAQSTSGTPTFVLDGRFMRAFNGPGMSRRLLTDPTEFFPPPATPSNLNNPPRNTFDFVNYSVPFNAAAYANFRLNGTLIRRDLPADGSTTGNTPALGDPDIIGMDEDYDACDLENWFLAIQSADGEVMIPSFHRPGILTATDWTLPVNNFVGIMAASKILRPRQADNSVLFPSDPLPDASGKIKYDVDNDGDGVSDSVWLDLGYPVQRDSSGKVYKPLFAFMVLGQNGRLPLNTVGNLQARDWQTSRNYSSLNTPVVPKAFDDGPLWDHASHLGASVNEINPKFALQNAPANVFGAGYSQVDNTPVQGTTLGNGMHNTPLFNADFNFQGVPVDLTQLRNILAGTFPHPNPRTPDFNQNGERNLVRVDNQDYYFPNNMVDPIDLGVPIPPVNAAVNRGGVSPVVGRWGEVAGIPTQLVIRPELQVFATNNSRPVMDYNNPVRAGRSFYNDTSAAVNRANSIDSMDDDFDSNDPDIQQLSDPLNPARTTPYPARAAREEFEVEDAAGGRMIPVETERRFVTPRDPVGVGRLVGRNNRPNDANDFGNGYDNRGRVGFFRYFRPAGVPQQVTYPITSTGFPLDQYNMPFLNGAKVPDLTNNLLHGYESMRNPSLAGTNAQTIAAFAAMPFNMNTDWPASPNNKIQPPTAVPTAAGNTTNLGSYDNYVSTDSGPFFIGGTNPIPSFTVVNGYPMGGLNKDEADEMNLYTPNLFDSPFGPSDLEWLYRLQDVDGATLDSRLARLAPISFLNPGDGLTRRRLFSLESWDPISFAYANDNPNNAFPWNSRFGQFASANFQVMNQVPALNAAYQPVDPTSNPVLHETNGPFANAFSTLYLPNPTLDVPIGEYRPTNVSNTPTAVPLDLNTSLVYNNSSTGRHSNWGLQNNPTAYPVETPAVAHRDRRINLNQPLPVSNDPAEPVRQKWVRETYQFLKAILPPQSVDTPQELAALSQYVVNIIDFRDPDCTMTRFVNTDLEVVPAADNLHGNVQFARVTVPSATSLAYGDHHFPYDPSIYEEQIKPTPTAWWTAIETQMNTRGLANPPLAKFLVQYGMEYNPVALNEVLAYQTTYKSPPGTVDANPGTTLPTSRIYIELVNTLTDAQGSNSSDLDIGNWELVLAPDNDARGRPHLITGNLTDEITAVPGVQRHTIIANTVVNAVNNAAPSYFVLSSPLPGTAAPNNEREENPPTASSTQLPPTFVPPNVASGNGAYHWLYLLRPANPFDPTRERVVVDCIRFPFINTRAKGISERVGMTSQFRDRGDSNGTNHAYSAQRLQPFRGGHEVANNGTAPILPYPGVFGFSEETAPPPTDSTSFSRYYGRDGNNQENNPGNTHRSSLAYRHTIGQVNNPADVDWDYVPFHDRDFSSVAELLLVPGCPPGLFTKWFAEEDYPGRNATAYNNTTIPAPNPPSGNNIGGSLANGEPRVFPYLPDKFYYTAASVNPFPTNPMPNGEKYVPRVGEMTGAGWHKMLEFFEVPSSANGAIGTVASGDNFDWFREDRRPGLLNLNLIIDEEVFFGLIDDPRLNSFLTMYDYLPSTTVAFLPQVVTMVDGNGYPALPSVTGFKGFHPISSVESLVPDDVVSTIKPSAANVPGEVSGGPGTPVKRSLGRGFSRWDPRPVLSYNPVIQMGFMHGLKAGFSDFLKIRHGGSGYLFGFGSGVTGAGGELNFPNLPLNYQPNESIAAERPFRSLSFPDINSTVLRPATVPASLKTFPNLNDAGATPNEVHPDLAPPYTWRDNLPANNNPPTLWNNDGAQAKFVGDPGVKNPFVSTNRTTARIPLVPSRRLFQIPDNNAASNAAKLVTNTAVMQHVTSGNLSMSEFNLVEQFRNSLFPFPASLNAIPDHADVQQNYLGSGGTNDNRQHPAYRIEWLQKVMNLTTVRTHQFAVWITVGFFEVLKTGSPTFGIPDTLGAELGSAAGTNVRYRSFFLLDRTLAAGYNPYNPGDFRDVVTYRRRIE